MASLVVAPLLLALVVRRSFGGVSDFVLVSVSAVVLALVMATINTWGLAADGYRWGLGLLQWPFRMAWHWTVDGTVCPLRPVVLTMDLTDLCTLPAAAVSPLAVYGRQRRDSDDSSSRQRRITCVDSCNTN